MAPLGPSARPGVHGPRLRQRHELDLPGHAHLPRAPRLRLLRARPRGPRPLRRPARLRPQRRPPRPGLPRLLRLRQGQPRVPGPARLPLRRVHGRRDLPHDPLRRPAGLRRRGARRAHVQDCRCGAAAVAGPAGAHAGRAALPDTGDRADGGSDAEVGEGAGQDSHRRPESDEIPGQAEAGDGGGAAQGDGMPQREVGGGDDPLPRRARQCRRSDGPGRQPGAARGGTERGQGAADLRGHDALAALWGDRRECGDRPGRHSGLVDCQVSCPRGLIGD